MKVLVIESGDAEDFYDNTLDGVSTHELLKLIGVSSELRFAVNKEYFEKALQHFAEKRFDVLHISAHGSTTAFYLANDDRIKWAHLAELFQTHKCAPDALVMSVCFAASEKIDEAFEAKHVKYRPGFIFGSTDARNYHDYAAAWSILYRVFRKKNFDRGRAKMALRHVNAVVHEAFVYRRWDEDEKYYKHFPVEGKAFEVVPKRRKDD